ncbi:LytTR family DNA-binding domain-containing protein [Clostridia bacterium OttesenSCG-928-O13]|nr:LytTR family DNA-binding domain-containing protein [Clostridia bacterium OttesenSCG-928-O13]
MKCAICDDDYAFARSFQTRVLDYCKKRQIACSCNLFLTPSELLLEDLDSFDIIFLNVDMGCWDGINIARSIRRTGSQTLIIFVSNHLEYAPEGYSVGAFRYLLKSGLDKTFADAMDAAVKVLRCSTDIVSITSNKETYEIPLSGVLYAESDKRTVTLYLADLSYDALTFYTKLSDLESDLAGKGFLRVHKSYLVNMQHVADIRNYTVFMKNGQTLPTSRQGYSDITGRYRAWQDESDGM